MRIPTSGLLAPLLALAALLPALASAAGEAAPEKAAGAAGPGAAKAPAPLPKTPPAPDPDKASGPYLRSTLPKIERFDALETAPHPIIVVLIDALRPDHLGYNGYPRDTTPRLDAFAREAVSFNNFYANAPWTRPSTTSILTGLTPSRHRVQCEQHKLAQQFVTLPEALGGAGYRTVGVVGNGNGASIAALDQGFAEYDDTKFFKGLPNAAKVFDRVVARLKPHRKQDRLFMFTFVVDPHDPYKGPSAEAERRWLWEGHPEIVRVPRWEYSEGQGLTVDQRRAVLAVYDSAVRYTDQQLGRLFDRLKKLGIYDKATIIVTADHGDGFGEHGFYKHAHHFWDEVVRVPFLVKSPAIPPEARGKSLDVLAQSVDIYPTALALAGAPPRKVRGTSLFELAARPEAFADREVFSEYNCFGISRTMLRTRDWKIVLQQPADEEEFMSTVTRKDLLPSVIFDREELKAFRLSSDPLERSNVVPGTDPAKAPDEVKPLLESLRGFMERQPGGRERIIQEMDPATEANLRALGYIE